MFIFIDHVAGKWNVTNEVWAKSQVDTSEWFVIWCNTSPEIFQLDACLHLTSACLIIEFLVYLQLCVHYDNIERNDFVTFFIIRHSSKHSSRDKHKRKKKKEKKSKKRRRKSSSTRSVLYTNLRICFSKLNLLFIYL